MKSSNAASDGRRPLKSRGTGWARAGARWLAAAGVRPNAVSVASVFIAAGASVAFWASGRLTVIPEAAWLIIAAALIQLRLLCNLFDGMIAIEGGFKTRSGEIYNELPDRFADLLIIGGSGYVSGAPDWQPVAAWVAAGLAVTTAYVRAMGVAAGASQMFHGPMAKPHRMALLTFATLATAGTHLAMAQPPPVLAWTLVAMSIGCLVTIYRRTRRVLAELESK